MLRYRCLTKVWSGAGAKAEQTFSFSKPLILMNQPCWCGNRDLHDFSREYWRCDVCSTLISKSFPSADVTAITDEESDFYGKKYWLDHQVEELGLASIAERSRSDLLDRCGWWLAKLLEYSLPPARLLEIGCSHGGFLALAELAGFRVTGIELSPWVVEFARKSFGVDVRTGPIERHGFQAGSFDVICMFDVLEHLQDPVRTLRSCVQALTPNGILLVQTPQYPFQSDFAALQECQHPFLKMMLPDEHLFLFNSESVKRLLTEVEFSTCEFVPAPFAHYDMMFAAGKNPLSKNSALAKQEALDQSAGGRVIQALFSSLQETVNVDAERQESRAHLDQAKKDIQMLQSDTKRLSEEKDRLVEEKHLLRKWLRQTYAERNELRKCAGFRAAIKQSTKPFVSDLEKRLPPWAIRSARMPVRVSIDLTGLLAMGENRGLTLAVMDLFKHLRRDERFEFIYLAVERSYAEVNSLLRPRDSAILISLGSQKTDYGNSQVEVIQTLTAASLKRHRTDIFYAPFGNIPAAARNVKTVCLVPDLPHRDCPELVTPDRLDDLESTVSNTLSNARRVQVPSEYIRQRLLEAYPIRPEETFVTYLRLDNPDQAIPPTNSRTRPYFLCPNGYYSGKSIEILLSGYKEYLVSGRTSGWAIVLAGYNDDRRHALRDLVHSLELDDDVEFENNLQGETWTSLFRAAGALLYPAFHEGAGIPILEAFRYLVPVICSSVGSLPEVAGDAAIYVNPQSAAEITQAMLQISLSAETRSGLVKAGSRRLEMFNPDEQVRKLQEAFLDLCTAK